MPIPRWGNQDFYEDSYFEDDIEYCNLELSDMEAPVPTDAEVREFYSMFCHRCGNFGHTSETCQWEPEYEEFRQEFND